MLEIKEEGKFFSRLLSKESSICNPSFRVYYGGVSVAVPFLWEVRPGTPKHPTLQRGPGADDPMALPPLTPPPSYFIHQPNKASSKRSNILNGLFPRMTKHRRHFSWVSTSSSSSSSFSSFGSEQTQTRIQTRTRSRTMSSPGSFFDFVVDDRHQKEEEGYEGEELRRRKSRSRRANLFWGCWFL